MTPLEKADRIIQESKLNLKWHYYDNLSKYDKIKVINCSLLVINELIDESRNQGNIERFKYFREVKKQIENHDTNRDIID
jgi:hypothetical protein